MGRVKQGKEGPEREKITELNIQEKKQHGEEGNREQGEKVCSKKKTTT